MAEFLPSSTESILYIQCIYIYIYAFLDVCRWWQFEHIREVHFFPTRPLCFWETLFLGMFWWRDFVWLIPLMEPWWNHFLILLGIIYIYFQFFVLDVISSSRSWGTWEVLTEDSDSVGRNLKFLVGKEVTAEYLVSRGFDYIKMGPAKKQG